METSENEAVKARDPLLDYLRRPSRRRLQAVVREHYELVWRVAHRVLGNDEDAADVSQDVFLRLLLHPPAAETIVSPKGYLSWCVVGRASTLRRSAERRRERERASLERLSRGGLATDDLDTLRVALESLPLELRQVIELRYLAEMPTREIAEVLSISERAVRLRAEKAREALRGRLAPIVCGVLAAGGPLLVEAVPPPPPGLLDGLVRISRMAVPLGTQAAAPGASAGLITGASIMSTKSLSVGAVISVLILWGLVRFLSTPGDVPAARAPSTGEDTRAVETAARLPGKAAAPVAALPAAGGAAPREASGDAGPVQAVSLEGKVTSASGEPIAGARVMALERKAWELALEGDLGESSGGPLSVVRTIAEKSRQAASRVPRARTAADGAYAFRGLAPGEYRVLAVHPEHLPRRDAWAVVEAESVTRADIVLEPARILAGKVLDDAGEPVAGAAVSARPTASAAAKGMGKLIAGILESTDGSFLLEVEPARTDASGLFSITGLEPVLQDIIALDERRGRGDSRGIPPGKTDCVIVLSRGMEVSGRVLMAAGGPVRGARITIGEPERSGALLNDESLLGADVDVLGERTRRGTTGEDGRFRILVFERGDLEIRVQAPRRLERVEAVRVERSGTDLGDLVLEEPSSISGVVLGPGDAPVEGARVSARENPAEGTRGEGRRKVPPIAASAETDRGGRFTLEGLSPGSHALEARAVSYPSTVIPEVQSGGAPIEIRLAQGLA